MSEKEENEDGNRNYGICTTPRARGECLSYPLVLLSASLLRVSISQRFCTNRPRYRTLQPPQTLSQGPTYVHWSSSCLTAPPNHSVGSTCSHAFRVRRHRPSVEPRTCLVPSDDRLEQDRQTSPPANHRPEPGMPSSQRCRTRTYPPISQTGHRFNITPRDLLDRVPHAYHSASQPWGVMSGPAVHAQTRWHPMAGFYTRAGQP